MISVNKQEELLSYLPEIRETFSGIANIQIIGLGAKQKKGKILNECAFRFYVKEKLPLDKVPESKRIPSHLFGIQTDVISNFQKQSLVSVSPAPVADEEEYRNIGVRGGISIRNQHFENDHPSGYGTLGVLGRRVSDDALIGLTCSHVVNAASETQTTLNTRIGQPRYWISCCCCPRAWVGDVKKATATNDLDCALIKIHDDCTDEVISHGTENKVQGIPADITGAALPLLLDSVKKHGRASGLTTGRITDINFGPHQMLIELTGGNPGDAFAYHGDSGAVILNEDNQVIGLLVAAFQETDPATSLPLPLTRGIATRIKPVMEDLDIKIAGVTAAEVVAPVRSKPWPGGQVNADMNPTEIFTSADFGFTGNVNWDVSGGAPGAIIIETTSQTATNLPSISVKYSTVSATNNKTDAVLIKATKGTDEFEKLRTVFRVTPRINTSATLDANNTKRFESTGGKDDRAGTGLPGGEGASWFMAKTEIIFEVQPTGIQWDGAANLNFVDGAATGTKGDIIARRQTKFNKGKQESGDANRIHTEEIDWVTAGDSTATDFQAPSTLAGNAFYRLANEGFDPANLLQGYHRADYRDYLEMHDGTDWVRICDFAEWFANLTADLNGTGTVPPVIGALNGTGPGTSPAKIPNQPPVVALTSTHREFKFGETVTLAATATDPNNDLVTIKWNKIQGPAVALSSPTGDSVTFQAPNDDFQYRFQALADDGTGNLARTAGNHLSEVDLSTIDPTTVDLSLFTIMSVNVIDWKNTGGGDPVPERNMTETFDAAMFGIGGGALNWDVTQGNTDAEIIEADGVAIAPPTGTHNGATTIVVRYKNKSADLTRAASVKVTASNPVNGKVWFKRRTVFRVTVAVQPTDTKTHKIPSTLGAPGKDHFCTVKQAGNLVLLATLDPVPPDAQITWDATGRPITSPSVGGNRKTAHINRNPASGMRIPIKVKVDGNDVYEGLGWIIWSTVAGVPGAVGPTVFEIAPGLNEIGRDISFTCTIQPATIISATPAAVDIPNLTGANRTSAGVLVPTPNVIAGDPGVARATTSLAAGATKKWDVSRQIRVRLVDTADISSIITANSHFMGAFPNYPSTHPTHGNSIGNDDEHDTEENNDPYANGGVLRGFDKPAVRLLHAPRNVGDTFVIHLHFKEFTRVLLDDTWYKCSDFFLWRSHLKGKKVDEAVDGTDYDGDGNQTDKFWIDDGSVIALNNSNF